MALRPILLEIAEPADIALELARRGPPLVDRVAHLADDDRLGRIARDVGLVVLREAAASRRRRPRIEPDDEPLDDRVVDASPGDPAMAILVVVDDALADVVLVIDRHDVVDADLGDRALVAHCGERHWWVPVARRCSFLRSFAVMAMPTAASGTTEDGEYHEQDPDHAPNIHAALHQRNWFGRLDTPAVPT